MVVGWVFFEESLKSGIETYRPQKHTRLSSAENPLFTQDTKGVAGISAIATNRHRVLIVSIITHPVREPVSPAERVPFNASK